ncbi:MAG: S-layer homology domain-containing protein [Bacteroidaceae bacterium]|nr:S-layer homology domain-containing protein [Bacteroidaceae bacterium]
MLNLKKVIALVCVFALTLTTVAFGATYSDVTEDSAYYEAVETLNKLGIITGYEDGTFKPEDGVTRAEMAALIARIQGYGETAKGAANTGFTDVPSSHWASGYIANAAGMGIINGYGDGTFGPEDPVLYEQAVKMVMATLGYTPYAEKNGGYPTGYLAAAQRYSVSLAVANAAVGQPANRGTVAQLLENALDTPLMIQASWNTNGEVTYVIADGTQTTGRASYKTLMSENLGYVKIRGIVEKNLTTDIVTASNDINTTLAEKVRVGVSYSYLTENDDYEGIGANGSTTIVDKTILVGDTNVADLLGRTVIGYIKKIATDEYEFVSVAVDTNRNATVEISLDQFVRYDAADAEIDYYKEGANTESSIALNGNIPVVYNNVGGYNASNIAGLIGTNFGGKITFINNDIDNDYDVAIIKKAVTAVVDDVVNNGIVFHNVPSGFGQKLYIYPDDETKIVTIIKDGAEIDYTELAEWDVLSLYAVNRNSDVVVAEVVATEVSGTITATKDSTTSATNVAYKVDGEWYDAANGYYADATLEIGAGGKFYIDEFGKIAAFIEDDTIGGVGNFGYVREVTAVAQEWGGNANAIDVKMQLLTKDGLEVLTVKNNSKLNATTLDVANWVGANFATNGKTDDVNLRAGGNSTAYDALDALTGAVVKYTKDSNGYISKLVSANWTPSLSAEPAFESVATTNWVTYDAEYGRFVSGANNGGYLAADATVFVIGATADQFMVATAAELSDKQNYTVSGVFKTKGADENDMIVVNYGAFVGTSATTNLAVIKGIDTEVDKDYNTIYRLTYLKDGKEVTSSTLATVYDTFSTGGTLTVGDVVKVKLDGEGVITSMAYVWNFNRGVRSNVITSSNSVATVSAPGAYAGTNTGEDYIGGKLYSYNSNTGVATYWIDTATNPGTADASELHVVKLKNAASFYEINNNFKDISIEALTYPSFEILSKDLYDTTVANVAIRDSEGKAIVTGSTLVDHDGDDANDNGIKDTTEPAPAGDGTNVAATPKQPTSVYALESVTEEVAKDYADYVYVRLYDGKPVDVIVVKGCPIQIH